MENNEQKATEEVKTETPTENKGEGDKPRELDKVERAEQAVKRMEEAEKRLDEKIAKLTELEADRVLGSSAGVRTESMSKSETMDDKAKKIADEISGAFK